MASRVPWMPLNWAAILIKLMAILIYSQSFHKMLRLKIQLDPDFSTVNYSTNPYYSTISWMTNFLLSKKPSIIAFSQNCQTPILAQLIFNLFIGNYIT